jgi:hypothetical protein
MPGLIMYHPLQNRSTNLKCQLHDRGASELQLRSMSLRSDCPRASAGGQCPIAARPSHALVGTQRIEEGAGSGDRLWAILRNWTLMTANGLAANQRRLTPKSGQPATESLRWRRSSCSSMAWAARASRMSRMRPELVLRRFATRGSPAEDRPWSFGCGPSGCGSRRHPACAAAPRPPSHLEPALDEGP